MSEIIEIAKTLDFAESEISDLLTILTYREEVNTLLINRLKSDPDATALLLRVILSNPRGTIESLEISLDSAIERHQFSLGPYQDKHLNQAHFEARRMGKASEFEQAIKLLGDSVDPEAVLEKLRPDLTEEDFIARYGNLVKAMDALGVIRLAKAAGYSYKRRPHLYLIDALNDAYSDGKVAHLTSPINLPDLPLNQEAKRSSRPNKTIESGKRIEPGSQPYLAKDTEPHPQTTGELLNEIFLFSLMAVALLDFTFWAMEPGDVHYASDGPYLPPILLALLDPLTSNNSAVNIAFGTGFFLLWLSLAISAIGAIIGLLFMSGHDPLYLRIRAAGGFGRLYLTLFGSVLLLGLVLTIATWS